MSLKAPVTMPKTDREFMAWLQASHDLRVQFGAGSPEGEIVADRGTLYLRTDGSTSTTLYVKTADDGLATGWSAK
jgi:hypothetical protein